MADIGGQTAALIGLFVGILLFGILLPVAINNIYTASVSGWSTDTTTLWYLVPLISVVAVVIGAAYTIQGHKGE